MTSRACYGSDGLSCTKHTLGPCQQNLTIDIVDAYFIGNRGCRLVGITSCSRLNLPDTYGPRYNFTKKQTDMFNVCLNKSSCNLYPAPRNYSLQSAISLIVYMCTQGRFLINIEYNQHIIIDDN
jgi:hypothetical protein